MQRQLSDEQETELASGLMELTGGLGSYLGELVVAAAGGNLPPGPARSLAQIVKSAARQALPAAGRAVGGWPGRGAGGARIGPGAAAMFGLELDGLSAEDRELEVARAVVRFADAIGRAAGQLLGQRGLPGPLLVRGAVAAAAAQHAPGFLEGNGPRARGVEIGGKTEMTVHEHEELGEFEFEGGEFEGGEFEGGEFEFEGGEFEHEGGEFEFEGGEFEGGEFEGGEFEYEVAFNEMTELELASELMEITNEYEFEQFLGKLMRRAARGVRSFARSGVGRALGGVLKSVARKALPMVGGALGNLVVPGVGGMIGSKLGSMAGRLFEFEHEGLAEHEVEFEAARRFVRLAGASARAAARAPRSGSPQSIAQRAVSAAVRRQLSTLGRPVRRATAGYPAGRPARPGVAGPYRRRGMRGRRPGAVYGYPAGGSAGGSLADASSRGMLQGTWVRRGDTIVLFGA
jgi:hypothetical protein